MRRLNMFGWAANHSGCGNYRIGLPMWALGQAGHDALAFSVLNVEIPDDLDILVGQVVLEADRSAVWTDLAARPGRSLGLVFEIDDDIWNVHHSNVNARSFLDEAAQRIISRNIEIADAVTVTTPRLAEVVGKYNRNVFVLPNCIDQSLLDYERPITERLTIGWAGGSSHHQDFAAVEKDLKTFLRRNPEVDTHFIGANYGPQVGRPASRFSYWSANLVEYLKKVDFDIGIAPLAYHPFNRGKSDLKFLEYAALGIPVVASDFGPYSDSIEHGVTGFLVKRPHEWSTYLRALVNDHAMRAEIGRNAKNWAATRTIQRNIWRWEQAYRSVIDARTTSADVSIRG